MNWVSASLIMFFSSVALYLFVRKSQLDKNPNVFNNLAMFLLPCIGFGIINFFQSNSLMVPTKLFMVLVLSAVLFSYLGNVFSLASVNLAPNPGYSLIISKSYVVYTTITSIFLFNSSLSAKNL